MEGRSSTIPTASKKMIIVTLNEDRYAYDIHSLVKAFYPEQEIKVFVKGTKEERSDAGLPAFFVEYYETSICAGIENGEAKTVHLKMPENRGTVKNDSLGNPDRYSSDENCETASGTGTNGTGSRCLYGAYLSGIERKNGAVD